MSTKLRITQTRSSIKRPARQRKTLQSLKLGKLHRSVEVECTQQIQGMINSVIHLVTVDKI